MLSVADSFRQTHTHTHSCRATKKARRNRRRFACTSCLHFPLRPLALTCVTSAIAERVCNARARVSARERERGRMEDRTVIGCHFAFCSRTHEGTQAHTGTHTRKRAHVVRRNSVSSKSQAMAGAAAVAAPAALTDCQRTVMVPAVVPVLLFGLVSSSLAECVYVCVPV